MTAMHRPVLGAVAVALILQLVPWAASTAAADDATAPTRLLVTYTAPVDGDTEAAVLRTASLADGRADVSRVQILEFDHLADAQRSARHLRSRPDVLAVEPDHPLFPDGGIGRVLPLAAPPPGPELAPAASSWGVSNDGQVVGGVAGRRGIDVGAMSLWSRTTGRDVVVAVIDSGVDISHPLLEHRIWRNPAETTNGRDSDGNGYVDDVHGWNFVQDSPQVFRSVQNDGHGTHVAGIIAGDAHPASGYRSVAPGARIMPLKFIDGDEGRTSDAIAALRYAEANGADVVNASWGGPEGSAALRTALAELSIPVVVAAGNLGNLPGSPPAYPAAYGLPNVISVAAIDVAGSMPAFSSRSRDTIDVAAPGDRILSTFPDGQLAEASGTSQAAPHVAGILALALQRHPDQDPVALARSVRDTVRPLRGATATRSGGLVRAPGLIDRLGTRVPACTSAGRVPFVDVSPDGAHHDAVACMLTLGVTRGTTATTYGSSEGLTRAQISTMLAGALGRSGKLPPPPPTSRFTDLAGNVHRDNVEVLAALGIVRGETASRFGPSRIVTRAEFAAVVARAAEWLADGQIRAVGPTFGDTAGHPDALGIDKAAGLRIVTGRQAGVFDPDVPLRRDQAASMVSRLLDRLVQQGLVDAA